MLFDRLRNDKLAVPAAMAFVVLGLMLIAVAVAFPHFAGLEARFPQDRLDFFRGLVFGIAIALELTGIAALIPAISAARRKSSR